MGAKTSCKILRAASAQMAPAVASTHRAPLIRVLNFCKPALMLATRQKEHRNRERFSTRDALAYLVS